MDGELIFEIARYSPQGEQEELLDVTRVLRRGEELWRCGADETPCSGRSFVEVIAAEPGLAEVHADQITRIRATEEALRELPLLLSVPGGGELVDEERWSQTLWDEHLAGTGSVEERDAYRVLYVNDARWAVFSTSAGERLLPEDPMSYGMEPLFAPRWAELRFTETGSMTSGVDRSAIGLLGEAVVACTAWLDEMPPAEVRLERRGDDAALFADWLLNGPLPGVLFEGTAGDELLTRLFVEASLKGHNGEPVPGSRLVGPESAELVGGSDSGEWTLRLSIEPALVQAVLDALAARSPRLAAIVAQA